MLSNVRFYLVINCINLYFRLKATPNLFPLCSACADTMKQDDCTHSDEERCIVRTWIVGEVRKAVYMGYRLVEVFEFWEYEVTCFEKKTPIQVFSQST